MSHWAETGSLGRLVASDKKSPTSHWKILLSDQTILITEKFVLISKNLNFPAIVIRLTYKF